MTVLEAQPGPQTRFLASPADIAVYGGAAGGGKTWALLFEPLRHVGQPGFNAVIFRRNAVQVKNPGGLWDETQRLYPPLGAQPLSQSLEWVFPQTGGAPARIKFAHLEHEQSVLDWQGSQICLLCFDELTHFSEAQFFYMLSRNRSLTGIRPYVRATCNPDADSWVAGFLSWWIDPDSGLPIPERSGALRYMARDNNRLIWAERPEQLTDQLGPDCRPRSVTFIAASLQDNRILMRRDPDYLANLKALPLVERERLLGGNWKIKPRSGLYFRRGWCGLVEAAPAGLSQVRYWDLAATEKRPGNDPDYTVSVKIGRDQDGRIFILDVQSLRASPHQVRQAILNAARLDGPDTLIGLPQDPGQAGKAQALDMVRRLSGFRVRICRESGDKITRFGPFSAQAEAGNVQILSGPWNSEFFVHLEAFPEARHDDHADACSGAFNLLAKAAGPLNISPLAARRAILRRNIK